MPPATATDKPRQPPLLEYGLLLLLSTLWGASFSFLKLTVASIPPLTAISFRTGIAGLLLYAIIRWQGIRFPRDWESWKSLILIAAVNTVFPFIFIAWGLQTVDASLAVILNSTTPVFAFLINLAITRQEPVTSRRLFGVSAGLAGICLIVGMSALSGLGQQLLPQLAIVLASVSYATSAIYGRALRTMNPTIVACGSLLVGAAVLTPMALVVEHPWTASPTVKSMSALFVLAVLCTAGGNVLYFRLLGTLGSLGTTAQSYLRVPIGVLAGVFLVGETLTSTAGIGLVCVVAGVMAMTWPIDKPFPYAAQAIALVRSLSERIRSLLPPLATEYALLVTVAALWAGSYSWVKIALQSIPPVTLMAGRISIAALCLYALARARGVTFPTSLEGWKRYANQGLVSTVAPFILVGWGQQWVDAGPAAILNSVSPVFAFLFTWALTRHEPATPFKLAGVLLGIAGVAVVMGWTAVSGLGGQFLPQLALVVSAAFYAFGAINSRHFRGDDPVKTAACALMGGSFIIIPLALVVERPWNASPTAEALLAMLFLGVVSTGLGYLLYFRLVRVLGSIGVSSQSYLRAPFGVLIAAIILGEPITATMIAGMALVIGGVALMNWERPPAPPPLSKA